MKMFNEANGYFMYGVMISEEKYLKWKNEKGNDFESVINEIFYKCTIEDISSYFNTRDGKKIIIGFKIKSINDETPIIIPEISSSDKKYFTDYMVGHYNGFFNYDDFHYFYIKNNYEKSY